MNFVPQKDTPKPRALVPVIVSLFGNSVFADIVKLKVLRQNHPGFRMGPKSFTDVLLRERRGNFETQRHTVRKPCDGRGRDGIYAAPSQEILGFPAAMKNQKEAEGIFP